MLVEIAIGDAYGAGFEYVSTSFVRQNNNLTGFVQHPRHQIQPGNYTDDTQMSVAIAELIVSGQSWSKENIAGFFVEAFKRDPREGYASGFYRFLCEVGSAEEFVAKMRPDSDKSGAAMRSAPIGVYSTAAEVVDKATRQARVTHDTVDGIRSAVAAALISHYFCYELGPKNELGRFLDSQVEGQWNVPWMEKVGPKGWMAVQAAVTAIMECDSMSKLLERCVAFEGDVDTVAAIALGAASFSSEVMQDLPKSLYDGLEGGPYGLQFLEALDGKLAKISGGMSR
jgi:ADP-ribosylglycohydrolase